MIMEAGKETGGKQLRENVRSSRRIFVETGNKEKKN
jgi:hypothetical protein